MDTRTVGKLLLEKVKCIGGLLGGEDQSSPDTDFNELVFGTTAPPVPSQKELIYWYDTFSIVTDAVSFYAYEYWYYGGRPWEFRKGLIWMHG